MQKNIKLQCLKSLIPNGGVSYNANYIQVLIDFGCGNSNQFSQVQNNLLLMDIINVNQYYQAYDNVGALHTFLAKNSEENNTKNNLNHILYSIPNNIINVQLQNDLNTVLLLTGGANPVNHIIVLKFNYDLI